LVFGGTKKYHFPKRISLFTRLDLDLPGAQHFCHFTQTAFNYMYLLSISFSAFTSIIPLKWQKKLITLDK
jgi:hypothetical protein